MRGVNSWWRRLLILGSMSVAFSGLGCGTIAISLVGEELIATMLRNFAGDLNDQAYELDGEPRTLGQWLDNLVTGNDDDDKKTDDDDEEDLGDLWEDLWN